MRRVLHIGCGLVGSIIAENLAEDFDVTVADVNDDRLERLHERLPQVSAVRISGEPEELTELARGGFDIATGAVTGRYAHSNAEAILRAGVSVCDISSFGPNDDMSVIDNAAYKAGCFYIPEIGIAPGMTNFLVGRGAALLERVENVLIYVGGFPKDPKPPFNYQATWSPADVIEEYYSQVRTIRNGKAETVRAVDCLHEIEFEPLGKLEAFVTDGLGTLTETIEADNMAEMTLRWPGHAEQMLLLREMGLFEEEPVRLGGVELVPREVLSDILLPMWEMDAESGDRDLLAFRVIVEGSDGDYSVTRTWELLSEYDEVTHRTAMSRATGLTCALFARAALDGKIDRTGLVPPELLAENDALYRFIMEREAEFGFNYRETVRKEQEIIY